MSTVVSLVIAFQFCVRLLLTILDVHDIVFNAMMIKLAMSRITISFFLKIIM